MIIYIPRWLDVVIHTVLAVATAVAITATTGVNVFDWEWWAIYLTSLIHAEYYGGFKQREQRVLIASAIYKNDPNVDTVRSLSRLVRQLIKNEDSKNEAGNSGV